MKTPSSATAIRIANLFSRRVNTPWIEKEIKRFRELFHLGFLSDDNLDLVERYYRFQRKRGDSGIHRRDLYTFLNNFPGELDRAREWEKRNPKEKPKKVYSGLGPTPNQLSDEEWKSVALMTQTQLREFRENWIKNKYDSGISVRTD